MSVRLQISLGFLAILVAGFYFLGRGLLDEVRPRYLESMEESLVDTANILASLVSTSPDSVEMDTADLHEVFDAAYRRTFNARIYQLNKTRVDLRVYVTDRQGIVIFDSDNGRDEGEDYSKWNDVVRTLRGEYGARSTRDNEEDERSSVLYVAAPVKQNGEIKGVLTVCKPTQSVMQFIDSARRRLIWTAVLAAAAMVVAGWLMAALIMSPLRKLTSYAKAVRDGQRAELPPLVANEMRLLGSALEEMRSALDGKQYMDEYVQTLTHELKSPLSAIHGAVELLSEDLPAEDRDRFIGNIRRSVLRARDLVDRMLELSAVEAMPHLVNPAVVRLNELVRPLADQMIPAAGLTPDLEVEDGATVIGDRFLLERAVSNLIQNAVDFSPPGGRVSVVIDAFEGQPRLRILDDGPGIPDFAEGRIFERFYSLERPRTGRKGTGLGLRLVREIADLHSARISIVNRETGGAEACVVFPGVPRAN